MLIPRRNQNWLPDVFNTLFDTDIMPKFNATAPAINVIEKEGEYDVELAAPGMTKEDFKVTLDEEENLVVALEKNTEEKEEDKQTVTTCVANSLTPNSTRPCYCPRMLTAKRLQPA